MLTVDPGSKGTTSLRAVSYRCMAMEGDGSGRESVLWDALVGIRLVPGD
jgi:hypothetical protein